MSRAPSAGAVVFALLVIATLAAFAWSQRLKRDPLVLDRVSFLAVPQDRDQRPRVRAFSPNGDCRFDRVRIRFRVTQSDRAHVQVVKPGGKLVVTLARDRYLKRYRFFTFYWDGRSREEGRARPGRYKLRVKMLGEDRALVPGGVMRLHEAPRRPTEGCDK
ncbi:MAG TPA: hypothetical protein VFY04_01150 [Solirubrobacterales bacterium]|nr:hypothetical protein [Solirubrobacterales bacterium]